LGFYFFALLKNIVNDYTLLIGAEGARLLWEYGSGETPQAQAPRRLAETPTESEAPGAEINRQV
jgi:hypothetical protein